MSTMEETGESQDSSTKEVTKRWGFRRSTIARREFMEEIGTLDISANSTPRRGARQPRGKGRAKGRGKDVDEMPSTSAAPKRGRGGRRSAPANLAPVPSPTDVHAIVELGGEGCADVGATKQTLHSSAAKAQTCTAPEAASDIEAASEAPVSDQAEDSDDLTLRELQERARIQRKLEEARALSVTKLNLNTSTVSKDVEEAHALNTCLRLDTTSAQEGAAGDSDLTASSGSAGAQTDQKRGGGNGDEEEEQNEDADRSSHDATSEENDPNALYCICRQKHNNRFMICCDRCQEWFHGDCVGISEARGRLLEENGEDYICPTCSPCQSPVDFIKQPALSIAARSSSSESLFSTSAGEDKPSEDEGIRGKIRKAVTRSTKRKFKIFQPVDVVAAVLEHEKVKEVKEEVAEEKDASPKCIGPGCANDALPESVYCGHQCIIRHAAVAMQSISEPTTQPQIQTVQVKPAPKPVPKIQKKTFLEKLFKRKLVEKPVKEEGGSSKKAVVCSETEEPVAALPSGDPEPKAAGAQESSAIAPSVFYKSTERKEQEGVGGKPKIKQEAPQPPNAPASSDGPEKEEKTQKVDIKSASPAPPSRKPGSNPLPSRAKKTMPGSPRLAGLRQLQTEPPQVSKSTLTVPEKEATAAPQDPTASSGPASEIRVLPVTPAPVPPPRPLQAHPNMQMRQNIRRSLTDTLQKRVNESDVLEMSESDVEKLAVNIEREMFNMYYTTDNKYKNKYRSLLLSLKDPRNKGLFYQVMNGQITPFKLTRMNQQELQCVQETAATIPKEESPPVCANTEEPLPAREDKVVKTENPATSSEEKAPAPLVKPAPPRKVSTAVSDIISSMLKDTTSEHRAHLFDLKCRICTGQMSAEEDPEVKKSRKDELKNEQEVKATQGAVQMFDKKPPDPAPAGADPVMESPASPTADDPSAEATTSDFSPLVIPEVSVVSITRRDPRTASYRPASLTSGAPTTAPTAPPPTPQHPPPVAAEKEAVEALKAVEPLPLPPPPPMPKSILMKPSAPSVPGFYASSSSATRLASSHTPTENETSQFLSKQDTVWKGFLNMPTVAKFVTKGYLISGSGSAELLKKDLPDTIHIGGRILPQTVWEYVDKVKTSLTKEMSLIRFHPATDEEEVAYVSLFSYFNSRRRFGVISNICNSIKDLYLIPLCAKEPVPSVLLPLEGPGLEEQHPNLLIGLVVCQKLKRLGPPAQEVDDKRPRVQMVPDSEGVALPIKPTTPDATADESEPYDPEIPIIVTPPGSPPATGLPDSSASSSGSFSGPSMLSNIFSVVNPPTSVKTTTSDLPPSSGACASSSSTPLQTILNTLFGKKKPDPVGTCEPGPSDVQESSVSSQTYDPIVQQYQQTPKNLVTEKMEVDDNDRPYDPEEEYDPEMAYISNFMERSKPGTAPVACKVDEDDDRPYDPEEEYNLGNTANSVSAGNANATQPSVVTAAVNYDLAYDPEDETVFEEMQTYLADNKPSTPQYGPASTVSLSEQQKMLEELNRQIEEQKRQLEEQEEVLRLQRAAVGVSMACFSVSDALMSPPPRFGREPEDAVEETPLINPSRDPRQCRSVMQDAVSEHLTQAYNNKENSMMDIMESSVRQQALTQATFLAPSNSSVVPDMARTEQELMVDAGKRDSGMPSVPSADRSPANLESHSTTQDRTHPSTSEQEEGVYSSSGNENRQRSRSHSRTSGKSRQSHSSKWDNGSPKRRSRHDRSSRHEERSSRVSREADRDHRRDRRSPDRSSRRSRSRSRSRGHREERVSSRQRDRRRHRSTSRHRGRSDRHSARSQSSRSGKSGQPKNERGRSPRQGDEPVQAQSINQRPSGEPDSQGDASQNEASGHGEQNRSEVPKSGFTKTDKDQPLKRSSSDPPGAGFAERDQFSQRERRPLKPNLIQRGKFSHPDTGPSCHEDKPAPGSHQDRSDSDRSDTRYQNRHKAEDNFGQTDLSELPSQMGKGTFSNPQSPLHHGDGSQVGPDQCHENKVRTFGEALTQRDDFPEDESNRVHHRHRPQSERALMEQSMGDNFHNFRDQRSNVVQDETAFTCQKDEEPFSSGHLRPGHSSGHEADHRWQLPQKTLQTQREGVLDHDIPYTRKSLSGPPKLQGGQFSNSDPDLGMRPSLGHRNATPQDEAHQMDQNEDLPFIQRPNFAQDPPQRPTPMHRRDFTLDESGQQRGLRHRPPPNDFHGPEAEQIDFNNKPSQNQRGSFSVNEDERFHVHDHPPQGGHSVGRGDLPQGDHDTPRNFYPTEQFRPRAPGDAWRGPQPRNPGPRGPPSLMTPTCPTAPLRPRMPRAPHPQRFENCGPGPNFAPRAMGPGVRGFDDAGPSPHYRPRGPSSGPEIFEGSEPQTFRSRGPNPDSPMFEDNSPQNSGLMGRFPPPGNGPQNFGPRGPGPGPRPGLRRPQHLMDGPSGPFQPKHVEPKGPFHGRGPSPSDSRELGAPHQFDREPFDSESDFRDRAPSQQFDNRDSPDVLGPFDEEEIDDRGFVQQHANRRGRPGLLQDSNESNSQYQVPANEAFSNPQDPRSRMRGRSRPQAGSPLLDLSERPRFPEMDSPDVCEGVRDHESNAPMKGPRFHPLQGVRGQRAPSPHFQGQRMPAPWTKELSKDKPYSPRIPRPMAPTSTPFQRPPGPTAGQVQSLQPQVRFDGPSREPDIRPLRLSGPLLPTPPGGPIRLNNPRMQRPYGEHSRPQGPPARAHNAGLKPGRCDDNSNHPQRETSRTQDRQREALGSREEDSSSQDSSPVKAGKPWRRRARKREGRSRAARRQRLRERREAAGEAARGSTTQSKMDNDQKA